MKKEKEPTFGVHDLTRDQMVQLKRFYLHEKKRKNGEKGATFAEFEIADDLVTDDEIYKEYASIKFTKDDFFHF